MKKYGFYLCAAAAIALIGCKDDVVVEKTVTPAQTGDEITFGSSLTDVGTRTIYGDTPVDGAYPVYWEEGDAITIIVPRQLRQSWLVIKFHLTKLMVHIPLL